ncbi:MAG TPA: DNA-processing protein DprA [Pseudonocardiaceae bacterium]|jgi:DNA processing protein|nr:DNA-processing protein DprA [Pseudonocardiaceae bacterium]
MPEWNDRERAALVALLKTRPDGLTWPEVAAEVADTRSAQAIWDKHQSPDLFTENTSTDALTEALDDVHRWQQADFRFLTFMDREYPQQLLEVHQFPPVLFTQGVLRQHELGVSVVGSRSASEFGIRNAGELARLLAKVDITVISGLAAGIDTTAHTSALESGRRTVAVIGTGINQYYPSSNASLQKAIARDGLVISQFWPDSPPSKSSFPLRNATMSAYGRATIVVEAGEQSGARIQARLAVAHGRPVVLMDAVVRGTNWGAKLRGQPGVLVANSPQEAVEHIEKIVYDDGQVSDLLAKVPS